MYHTSQNPAFIPGPTNIPEALRRACDMSTLDHRSAAFDALMQSALDGVRQVVQSRDALVVTFPSSGTGGWEAAITNTLSAGDKVLASRHGAFSHRWIDMCQRHGLDVEVINAPWHSGVPLEQYEERLSADIAHEIKVVLVTHNDRFLTPPNTPPCSLLMGSVPSAPWIFAWMNGGLMSRWPVHKKVLCYQQVLLSQLGRHVPLRRIRQPNCHAVILICRR